MEVISQSLFNKPIACHHYSLGHVYAFISLILSSTPMRCVERVLNFFKPLIHTSLPAPSWYSGRLWLMKLGYYKLHAQKTQAMDWIWIVDHSVQLGSDKCFVILGVRASSLKEDLTLSMEDVEPITLSPVKSSNGEVVYQELAKSISKTGIPMAIVGDKGSDLNLGVTKFCNETGTVYIHDIKHKVALLLKKQFEQDINWKSFTELAAKAQKHTQQTKIAGAAPPTQRSKARYMNIEALVKWGQNMLNILEKGIPEEWDKDLFEMKIGWVKFYKQDIEKWKNMMSFAITTESLIRKRGISIGITDILKQEFMQLNFCPASALFGNKLLSSVMQEELKVKIGQILIGSSEILEALFGKFKDIEDVQSKSGFTGLSLVIPALAAKTTIKVIHAAMEVVKVIDLKNWFDNNIGQSVQSQRVMFRDYATT